MSINWYCRVCTKVIGSEEVNINLHHTECDGICIVHPEPLLENANNTQKKFKHLIDNIPFETAVRVHLMMEVEMLKRYATVSSCMIQVFDGDYLRREDVLDLLKKKIKSEDI